MSRALFAAVAVLPLMLAAGSAVAQAHGGHGGHSAHAAPARPPQARPAPKPKPRAAAPQPRRVAPAAPATPANPHAGHDMGGMRTAPVQAPAADPHAGHNMSSTPAAAADPHAGHDMSGMQTVPAPASAADPHAGHNMAPATAPQTTDKTCTCPKCAEGGMAHDCAMPGASSTDPHAGHDMSGMQMAPAPAAATGSSAPCTRSIPAKPSALPAASWSAWWESRRCSFSSPGWWSGSSSAASRPSARRLRCRRGRAACRPWRPAPNLQR